MVPLVTKGKYAERGPPHFRVIFAPGRDALLARDGKQGTPRRSILAELKRGQSRYCTVPLWDDFVSCLGVRAKSGSHFIDAASPRIIGSFGILS